MSGAMRPGEVNDLGLGTCPKCKKWKALASVYWLDAKLPKKERRKCCAGCNAAHKRESDPFFFVKKMVAAHKAHCKHADYTFEDLKVLHVWQNHMCPYCGKHIHYGFTLDHIVPQKAEGKNILKNLLLPCLECNSSKQDFESVYWLKRKGYFVKPKILLRIKGAYDEHGYEFSGDCSVCAGSQNPRICSKTPGSPNRTCLAHPQGHCTGSTGSTDSTGSTAG